GETRLFHDLWWGKAEPIYVTALPRHENNEVGQIRHVRFQNILCRSENGAFLAADTPGLIDDIVLENVRIEVDKWSKWPGGLHDRRPMLGGEHTGIQQHPTAGVFLENLDNVCLRHVDVAWGKNRPDYFQHALEAHGCRGLELENFRGEAAHPDRHEPRLME
ncbi:MAG: hypothetical protein MI725_16265, partial [Pirellulales bacterium]|nr:hypothetical protein [Pirellulales bacterium]